MKIKNIEDLNKIKEIGLKKILPKIDLLLFMTVYPGRQGAEFEPKVLEKIKAKAKTLKKGTWGVILDIDETVLDNSEYEKEINVELKTHIHRKT